MRADRPTSVVRRTASLGRQARWMARPEAVPHTAGNIEPVKPSVAAQGKQRIDGVVAAVTALSRLMVLPDRPASPYAYRGVRTVG